MLLEKALSSGLFGFNGGEDVLTPPRKISLLRVFAWPEGKWFLRSDFWRKRRRLDGDVSYECWGIRISDDIPTEVSDGCNGFGAVFVNPGSALEDVGWSRDVGDGVHVLVMDIPFS